MGNWDWNWFQCEERRGGEAGEWLDGGRGGMKECGPEKLKDWRLIIMITIINQNKK